MSDSVCSVTAERATSSGERAGEVGAEHAEWPEVHGAKDFSNVMRAGLCRFWAARFWESGGAGGNNMANNGRTSWLFCVATELCGRRLRSATGVGAMLSRVSAQAESKRRRYP